MMLDKAKENMFGLTKAFMRENGTITNSNGYFSLTESADNTNVIIDI
jgi:hypothetical protein